jgi:hypothetical protein
LEEKNKEKEINLSRQQDEQHQREQNAQNECAVKGFA